MSVPGALLQNIIGAGVAAGFDALGSILDVIPAGNIGGISIQATIRETHTDSLVVTEHPVEQGAQISDHSYVRMPELVLKCGWSNSQSTDVLSAVTTLFSGRSIISASTLFDGGQMTVGDYVGGVYSRLLALQNSGNVFDIVTSIRLYPNMLITSMSVERDKETSQALMLTATCRQVRIVSTRSAKMPPITNQQVPHDTAEINDVGAQNLQPGSPSPTGSVPAPQWTF